ncbi:2-phospho-L-lactate guanylyltransferase [Natrarchaeobius oligotrophus]|uniref:2-phospho-L-lactate guanylyltransferase n=1 Tax=Natrarchaeobius chitinivorans TaxID=1679083 RepID=A0A3N6MDI1_NATCH|nr:2-phospho-L-lactate guanylyltransferase [Natrarchaeobius chitinivorans]RQG98824.1 2-phospho-L-lactate guanylyltransferase [Natrarchaeobius chitinivorans]
MQTVVPFDAVSPKTRLGPVLAAHERARFARAMLADVLAAVVATGREPTVLSTSPISFEGELEAASPNTTIRVDDRPLTEAIDAVLEREGGPVAVVMADLALATPGALEALFSADGDVVLAPGRGGGTNALVVRDDSFRVDFHGASYLDHRRIADDVGASLETVDSFRLGTDVDEPADLVEVLVHGTGRSVDCLRSLGFELERTGGRVDVTRLEESTRGGRE